MPLGSVESQAARNSPADLRIAAQTSSPVYPVQSIEIASRPAPYHRLRRAHGHPEPLKPKPSVARWKYK